MNQNIKTALIIGGVILAILIILPLVSGLSSGWQGGNWGMMGTGMMGGFGWMGLTAIFWIVLLGLIIWAVVAAVYGVSQPRDSNSSRPDSALEILKKRYARGELKKEEFDEKKKDLT